MASDLKQLEKEARDKWKEAKRKRKQTERAKKKAKCAKAEKTRELLQEVAALENTDSWLTGGKNCCACDADEFWPSETGYEGVGQCSECHGDICSYCFFSSLLSRKCRAKHQPRSYVYSCVNKGMESGEDEHVFEEGIDSIRFDEDKHPRCHRGIVCPKCVFTDVQDTRSDGVARSAFTRAKHRATVDALRKSGDL
jgi:hypothetical protein